MKQRRKSLTKILLLQEQLHKLSAWKLTALERERAALLEDQKATLEAIGRDAMTHVMMVASANRRLRAIDKQITAVAAQHAAQERLALEQGARTKLAERMVDRFEAKYRAQEERSELSDLIERATAKASASSA